MYSGESRLPRVALFLHRSNRLELLATSLTEVVQTPLADPFARECIVVQGPGMERWLAAFLSRVLGVWANPWFPFPRALIELVLEVVLGPLPEGTPRFDPEAMTWLIAQALPEHLDDPAFAEVASYLGDDPRRERLIELSQRLAERFDEYIVYRPERVLAWERGEEQHFQARLFRTLVRRCPTMHLAQRMRALERTLARGGPFSRERLPERVSLFGISTLPPSFVALLSRLSEHLDVHVFLLTPSEEYWGDLDRSEQKRGDLHGFLAQLGRVSREFLELLAELPYQEPEGSLFHVPGHDTMLRALQSDLVQLVARSRRGATGATPLAASPSQDESLRVHVCHSPVRELEVLRDHLRAHFERDPTLEPRDVIVFTPDIERYAPAIDAVFAESAARDDRSIPFRIADRRTVRASEVAESFFALLDLCESRLYLSEVLDFVHRACVRSRFEIEEGELERVQHWLVQAGARWALDAAHRTDFAQPRFEENSLRFALDRLLIGYSTADGEQRDILGVLPFADAEGREALLLGRVARFLETLFDAVQALTKPHTPMAFAGLLTGLLEALFSSEDELGIEHHALRGALADLASEAERAGFSREVSLASVRRLLERRLDRGRANFGFLAGGVTFCEPVPMRAIPFRVVCLLGMDDESFPRSLARPAFDLMAEQRRLGDRTLRDDDRQLFLEALLSARDVLHISYVGRSAQDDAERPASVLVDQLLRLCDQHFVQADASGTFALSFEGSVSHAIRREHALHRFDPRYFDRGGSGALFSYDASAAAAARSLLEPKLPARPFAAVPLPPSDPVSELSLDALQRFFRKPQEIYLKERLKLYLPRELDEVKGREPLGFDHLERFRLGDDLLRQHDTLSAEERARLLRKAGRLGPGSVGVAQLALLESMVQEVVDACPHDDPLPDRDFALDLSGIRLRGRLGNLTTQAHIARSVGSLHVRRKLTTWLAHLALCATGAEPARTRLVGREAKVYAFEPLALDEARGLLESLLQLYRIGMCMPLPLLHDASECYVLARMKGGDPGEALSRAQAALGGARAMPQSAAEDPHVLQIWSAEQLADLGALSASDGEQTVSFTDVAERVLGPLLGHMHEEDV